MKNVKFSVTLTCAITIFTIGNTHPVDVKTKSPLLNTDTEIVDFAKAIGSELLEIEPSGRTVRKYEKESARDSGQTFLCTSQGQVGVPHECKRYHVCARAGAESTGGVCFDEKLFHHQKRECLKITEAECHESMCKNISNKFADPYNRENYLVCTEMVPEVRRCPDEKIYYPQLKSCESGSAMKGLKESFEEEDEKVLASTNKPSTGIGEIRPKNKMGLNKPGQNGMQGNTGLTKPWGLPGGLPGDIGGMLGNTGIPGMPGNTGPQTKPTNNGQPNIPGTLGGMLGNTRPSNNGQPQIPGNLGGMLGNIGGMLGNTKPQTRPANNGQPQIPGNLGGMLGNIGGMLGNTKPANNGQPQIPGNLGGMLGNIGGMLGNTKPANNGQPQIPGNIEGMLDNIGGMLGNIGIPGMNGNNGSLGAALKNFQQGRSFNIGQLGDALKNGQLGDALKSGQLGDALKNVQLGDALKNGQLGDALKSGQLGDALKDGQLGDALKNGQLGDALKNGQLGAIFNNGQLGETLKNGQLGTIFNNANRGTRQNNVPKSFDANNGQSGIDDDDSSMSRSISINKKKRHFNNEGVEGDVTEDNEADDESFENKPVEAHGQTVFADDTGAQEGKGNGNSVPDPAEVTGDTFLVLPPPDDENR